MSGAPPVRRQAARDSDKATRKYLERYAEPEARSVSKLPPGDFGHVVVIPVYGEGPWLFDTLQSIPAGPLGETLVILILNAREGAPADRHAANASVRDHFPAGTLHEIPGGRLWLIDRAREGRYLPEKQGVGLARKIGCDVAFALRIQGRIRSRFIHWTDADAIVPPDYFARSTPQALQDGGDDIAALIHPFEHLPEPDPNAALAIRLYESFLRYYVTGLRFAGSPYAFHSIGSTIAIEARAYARVRGVPRVMAGEDFYCLDKLAKVGKIRELAGDPIHLSGRVSDRVPFGTGRAMTELAATRVRAAEYRLPHPAVFETLRVWLQLLNNVAKNPALAHPSRAREWFSDEAPAGLAGPLVTALELTGGFALLEDAGRDRLDPRIRSRRLHTAFDGFRTLKLLHALRDVSFPPLPFFEAIGRAGWLGGIDPGMATDEMAAVEAVRRALVTREKGDIAGSGTACVSPAARVLR